MATFESESVVAPNKGSDGSVLMPVFNSEPVLIQNIGTEKPMVITKQNRVIRK